MNETVAATGWYVFGVVPADKTVEGVDLVRHGDLAAVVTQVDLAEFGEEALRDRLNDRVWLEDTAPLHSVWAKPADDDCGRRNRWHL